MRLLLHICCGPCAIVPVETLRALGLDVMGYFFNPNIHPFREFQKRRETLAEYASVSGLEVIWDQGYDLESFLERTRPWGGDRCRACYELRLEATARYARERAFDAFTTTMLYSRYQKHDWIKEVGQKIENHLKVPFYYYDFRPGWKEGIKKSKALGLYRQPYCGCLFSEKERYAPQGGPVRP